MSVPVHPRPPVTVASQPYPWPWDGLDPSRLALVLAGWDAHWAARACAVAVDVAVARLAAATAAAGGVVVRTVHPVPPRARPGLPEPVALAVPAGATSVADGIDAFWGSGLEGWLRRRDRDQLLVAGHGLEGPVHSTLRSANDRGLECLLVTDACSPLDPDLAAAAASQVCMSGGIFGAVATVADVVVALAATEPRTAPAPSADQSDQEVTA